jgi:hypothetical protein
MPISRVQFQFGMSMSEFADRYGSEEQCASALEKMRWPAGLRCLKCGGAQAYRLAVTASHRSLMQCATHRHQTLLITGTVLDSSKLPLRTWFLGVDLVSQAKTGLSRSMQEVLVRGQQRQVVSAAKLDQKCVDGSDLYA